MSRKRSPRSEFVCTICSVKFSDKRARKFCSADCVAESQCKRQAIRLPDGRVIIR